PLRATQPLTVTHNLTLTDNTGLTSTKPLTITTTGTNDQPIVAAHASVPPRLTALPGTGNATADTATGSLSFTDVDLNDSHIATNSLVSTTWSCGASLPSGLATSLAAALATTVSTDSTGSGAGTVGFTFSAADRNFDF